MKTASVRDLRNNFAKVSRWLEAGEKVEITKRGVPLANLVPLVQPPKNGKHAPQKRFDLEKHRAWMKKVYGNKVFKDNIILTMREEKDW